MSTPSTPFRMTRREFARAAGISLCGGFAPAFRPANAWALDSATPRASAKQVLFINLEGGMSQVDSFDAKEGPWTPDGFDIRACGDGLKLPVGLMPRLAAMIDKTAVVRSMAAWDALHGRAQYYLQTGHPLNVSLAKEVPAIGAVICHELASQRRADDSLPAYITMNMAGNQAGLVGPGFLPASAGPLNLTTGKEPVRLSPTGEAAKGLDRRYQRLQRLDGALRQGADRRYADYHEYYAGAWRMMHDTRLRQVLEIGPDDRRRYGATAIGSSLVLARNLILADAGARCLLISHGGWDHHSDIYKPDTRNHQVLLGELDSALASLIEDLGEARSRADASQTLLDETLIVCMGEFGRTPGAISETRQGREHYIHAHCGLFAGGGVRAGTVIGATDEAGGAIVDFGWSPGRPVYMEDIACTIYSALGIDWTKVVEETPSGRAFHYVEPASGTTYIEFQPVQELFA